MDPFKAPPKPTRAGALPDTAFIDGGPKIPGAVLEAQDQGRLAILCGAGISMPHGLPDFQGLTLRTWRNVDHSLSTTLDPLIDPHAGKDVTIEDQLKQIEGDQHRFLLESLKSGMYDRALLNLERIYDRKNVRRALIQVLKSIDSSKKPKTHEALIDLATTDEGRLQLVTTNFDRLFEISGRDIRTCSAPTLTVPKRGRWNRLVYLHGLIKGNDPDGNELVYTSADFGRAYLTERWASTFVSELFRNYVVLMVGYSANDPVMRYVLDAVAADQELADSDEPRVYALATAYEEVDAVWQDKGVVAIPYNNPENGNHEKLHETLVAWAGLWGGGLSARKNRVYELGIMAPGGLSEEAHSEFIYAISDPSTAAYLADDIAEQVDIGWIDILADSQLLTNVKSENVTCSIVDRLSRPDQLFIPAPPPVIQKYLAEWIVENINNPDLLKRIISMGTRLHPFLRGQIQNKLDEVDNEVAKRIWRVMTQPEILSPFGNSDDVFGRIIDDDWTPSLRDQVVRALTPYLVIEPAIFSGRGFLPFNEDVVEPNESADRSNDPERIRDICRVDCDVSAGTGAGTFIDKLKGKGPEVLADLAWDVTVLLRRALDLFSMMEEASRYQDPSHLHQASIAPHSQNRHLHGWTQLIELARECFDAVLKSNEPGAAQRLSEQWAEIKYPTFRRLTLYATKRMLEVSS